MSDPKSLDEALAMLQADPPVLVKDKKGQVGNQKTKYADLVQVNAVVLSRLNALGVIYKTKPTLRADDPKFVLAYELKHVPSDTKETGEYPLKLSENPMQMGSAITYARRYVLLAITGVAAEDEDDDGQAASSQRYAQRAAQPAARQRPAPAEDRPTAQRAQRQTRPASARPAARPPLPGEDIGDTPPDPDAKVGTDQHRAMHALWRDLGYGGDENRDRRLAITAKILGLSGLESSADLTRGQADRVITALRDRKERMAGGGEPS